MKFEIYPRKKLFKRTQWYWRLIASNNEVIAQSEGYYNRKDAIDTCIAIRKNACDAVIAVEPEPL